MSAAVQRLLVEAAAAEDRLVAGLLKAALERLPAGALPLGSTGPSGGVVDDREVVVTVRRWCRSGGQIHADVGVFFQEVIGGCSCGDEPASLAAHARLEVILDAGGAVRFTLLSAD